MGWISFVQIRCIKYGYTNPEKIVRELVTSPQWDIGIEFVVKVVKKREFDGILEPYSKNFKLDRLIKFVQIFCQSCTIPCFLSV